jgi:hypothetical protein
LSRERSGSESDSRADESSKGKEILSMLRKLPESQAIDLLRQLREKDGPLPAMESLSTAQILLTLGQHQTARAALPPMQTNIEFELMMRHPMAYPTLIPVETAFMSIDDLIFPKLRGRKRRSKSM